MKKRGIFRFADKIFDFCRQGAIEWITATNEKKMATNEKKRRLSPEIPTKYIRFHSQKKKDLLGVAGENEAVRWIRGVRYNPLLGVRSLFFPSSKKNQTNSSSVERKSRFGFRRYFVLERNLRLPSSEFDVVAFDRLENCFVFFEVKTRRSLLFGQPYEAVDERRQRKMIKGAGEYLRLKRMRTKVVRFDVLSILWESDDEPPKIEHWPNAFDPLLFR